MMDWIVASPSILVILGALWWFVKKIVHISDAVSQLKPNGGSSIFDRVRHIESSTIELTKEVRKLKKFDKRLAEKENAE